MNPRGGIYDRDGREMALSIYVPSAYISIKKNIKKNAKNATKGCKNPKDILKALSRFSWINMKRINDAFNRDKGFIWIKRMLDPMQKHCLDALGIETIEYTMEPERFYPNLELAGQTLGFVGVDEKGLEGLEFYLDTFIKKFENDNISFVETPSRFVDSYSLDIEKEYNLVLTTDMVVQYLSESALKRGCQNVNADHGLLIIMDTHTGEILAMANWPGYNPNCFFKYPREFWRNRCITDTYEPGSIFKLIWLAALLEEGMAMHNDLVYCEQGSINIAGKIIRDHKEFGWLSLKQVIEKSSNIGAIKWAQKLGEDRFYEYIKRFGFGEKTGIEFPGEARGILRTKNNWSRLSLPSIAIGQEISVTPVQMITAFSALVNGGRLIKPVLLKEVRDAKNNIIQKAEYTDRGMVISPGTSDQIKNILRGAVKNGTGQKADVHGYWIGGKTGTAQLLDKKTGGYSHDDLLASFIGFFPDSNARWAMLVMVCRPKTGFWGGEVATPIFTETAEKVMRYMHIPPDNQENQNKKREKNNLPVTAKLLEKSST
ncbi:penicillin-binding protein 2 [bacterium]|nr:penicillin-binding protein 2 [bacterium]